MSNKYSKIGLKAGLEIHQQLDTKEKLFCSCKPNLFKEDPEYTFLRKLRPAQSELGQVDSAALFEFQKATEILYESNNESACLVEMDEEPPHNLNSEAVEICLLTALLMRMKHIDEEISDDQIQDSITSYSHVYLKLYDRIYSTLAIS